MKILLLVLFVLLLIAYGVTDAIVDAHPQATPSSTIVPHSSKQVEPYQGTCYQARRFGVELYRCVRLASRIPL